MKNNKIVNIIISLIVFVILLVIIILSNMNKEKVSFLEYISKNITKPFVNYKTFKENEQMADLDGVKYQELKDKLKEQQKETQNRLHTAKDIYIKSTHEAIIELLEEKIDQTSKRIEGMIKQKESLNIEYQNLQTIPAIGKETAVILLRHLTDKNFETANKFVAFAGLSPKIEQSGTSVNKKGRLSRYGHRQLKRALFMPAIVAYRMNAFPQLVRNLEAAKKPKMIIIVALMRKLAKIAFYIHKTKKPFDKARHQTV